MKKRFLFLALALCMIFTLGLALADGVAFPPATETEKPTTCEHYWVVVPAKAATCTEDGTHGHKVCSLCSAIDPEEAVIEALGHSYEVTTKTEATCTAGASTVETCSVCGDVRTTTGEALGHKWGDVVKGHPAKCDEDGANAYTECDVCDAVQVGEDEYEDLIAAQEAIIISASGEHAPEEEWLLAEGTEDKAPTCEEGGVTAARYCPLCYKEMKPAETVPATGHNWELIEGGKTPNCVEDGATSKYRCEYCDEEQGGETIPAMGHELRTVWGYSAGCTTEGRLSYKYCWFCNYAELVNGDVSFTVEKDEWNNVVGVPKEAIIPASNHLNAQGESQIVAIPAVAPTCTKSGSGEGGEYCTLCNTVITPAPVLEATGHTEVILPAEEATCTTDGLTEGKKCSVCGDVTVEQTKIDALGHTEVILPAEAATCTETGLTAGKKCSVCKEILVAQETIDALGHTEVVLPAEAATCTETGLTEGKYCSVCEEILVAQTPISALGHWIAKWSLDIPATCTENGWTAHLFCRREDCDWEVEPQMTPMLPHELTDPLNVEATCEEGGYKDYRECKNCNYTEGEQLEPIGHQFSSITDKAATCTEYGVYGAEICLNCGEMKIGSMRDPLGHDVKPVSGKAATCTEPGLTDGKKCTRCDYVEVEQEEIPALGHTEIPVLGTAATCTKTGLTDGTECTVCGETVKVQEEIPALGHTWGAWIVGVPDGYEPEAGVDDPTGGYGLRYRVCSVCGDFDIEVLEPLPPTVLLGDANDDGVVNIIDVLVIMKHSVQIPTDINLNQADYNRDGYVNILDAVAVLHTLV